MIQQIHSRLQAIDFLRGLVIVLMVLDHTRDFFATGSFDPHNVHDPTLFLTRWITHFCATVFIFLTGTSAFLYSQRKNKHVGITKFLLTRGLWLIIMELTIVRFAWTFNFTYDYSVLQVIWVIGVSMMLLAWLRFLPRWFITTFGIILIVGHNLFDSVHSAVFGKLDWIWIFIHDPSKLQLMPKVQIFPLYSIIPWVGVMTIGYAFGPIMLFEEGQRQRWILRLGVATTSAFIFIRLINIYGDPIPWTIHSDILATILSFINASKYPPSLIYLCMTLGPLLLILGIFKESHNYLSHALIIIGRVPLFVYITHLYLLHITAIIAGWLFFGDISWMFQSGWPKPNTYGFSLPIVYFIWIAVILMLYPLAQWFAAIKQRRQDWWLSYL